MATVTLNDNPMLGIFHHSTHRFIAQVDIHYHWIVKNTVISLFLFALMNFINEFILGLDAT
jgi:hypothetical protein